MQEKKSQFRPSLADVETGFWTEDLVIGMVLAGSLALTGISPVSQITITKQSGGYQVEVKRET
jgi:hypothetical protein